MNANEILTAAVTTLDQRGRDYDPPEGERSMGRIVAAFNALTDHEMTEAEGWQFMACLKLVRMGTASDPTDSAVDCAAYAALAGEALAIDKERSERNKAALEKARAAAPETEADGWIPWAGGECPVNEKCKVEFRQRDGVEGVAAASFVCWEHEYATYDIVGYRLVSEAPAAEKKDKPWRPEHREKYYYVGVDGKVSSTSFLDGSSWDIVQMAFGNCFRTEEKAQIKRDEIFGGK